jgi:hypothetical protein
MQVASWVPQWASRYYRLRPSLTPRNEVFEAFYLQTRFEARLKRKFVKWEMADCDWWNSLGSVREVDSSRSSARYTGEAIVAIAIENLRYLGPANPEVAHVRKPCYDSPPVLNGR